MTKITIYPGDENSRPVPLGKPFNFTADLPTRCRIETLAGTTIEAVLPPNSRLTICHQGDLKSIDLEHD